MILSLGKVTDQTSFLQVKLALLFSPVNDTGKGRQGGLHLLLNFDICSLATCLYHTQLLDSWACRACRHLTVPGSWSGVTLSLGAMFHSHDSHVWIFPSRPYLKGYYHLLPPGSTCFIIIRYILKKRFDSKSYKVPKKKLNLEVKKKKTLKSRDCFQSLILLSC